MLLFDEASRIAVTQFEYTYDPQVDPSLPDLYYDMSDVDDQLPRQFCPWSYTLEPGSSRCRRVRCPANCSQICTEVYNVHDDDHATAGCDSGIGLTLTLCG